MSLTSNNPSSGYINLLSFKLAKYDINGTFLSFDDLTTQLMICSQSLADGVDFWRFGITIQTSCTFDLTNLLGNNIPQTANKFFELFIVDVNGNLIDVPIKVLGLIDSSGATPNTGTDMSKYILVRRFFIFDTISGIKGAGQYLNQTTNTTALRWISSAKLVIELDSKNQE